MREETPQQRRRQLLQFRIFSPMLCINSILDTHEYRHKCVYAFAPLLRTVADAREDRLSGHGVFVRLCVRCGQARHRRHVSLTRDRNVSPAARSAQLIPLFAQLPLSALARPLRARRRPAR
ncbi:hypothetical protein EVAR_88005_1 [Eumeta japonica]|uniref:Uncharacterized protein n=1 Tax=Eumeta variegata TaxID=151549 RepID=A0A4C1VFH3_EUMVA|nr:hypothetical protein EVAR_88005_1 [Eumeta japonica]